MRCRTCDYRLWNLPSRQCPECGTPFRPRDYDFVPNSVQFRCPHCTQVYYGTGERGHLEPVEFDCIACARHVHMDEMVLLPAEGLDEEQTRVERMPWLDRRKRGAPRAWLSCVGMALVAPGRLMKLTPMTSSTAAAWWFAVFTQLLTLVGVLLPFLLFVGVLGGSRGGGPGVAEFGVRAGGLLCVGLPGFVAFIALEGLIAHGLLVATGKTAGGLGRTYQALCYGSGAGVVSAVPCLGWYVGWIWPVVSTILMLREGQRVHGGRAALGLLALPVLLIGGVIAFLAWMEFSVLPAKRAAMWAPNATDAQLVLDSLLDYAALHEGRGPRHAIELVADDLVTMVDLLGYETPDSLWFDGYRFQTRGHREQLVKTSINSLPAGTIAHRLGDFIFTYHGMDLNAADGRLWVVIQWSESAPRAYADGRPVIIYQIPGEKVGFGRADGTVIHPLASSIDALLAEQNALRVEMGLPAIPHPSRVTHASPAVGPPQTRKTSSGAP